MSLPMQENNLNRIDHEQSDGNEHGDNLTEAHDPSHPGQRRRQPVATSQALGDEGPSTTAPPSSSSSVAEEGAVMGRTISFDRLNSLDASPSAPVPQAALASASAFFSNDSHFERYGSPTLRMPSIADTVFTQQSMSARTPQRAVSELGPEAFSAPVSARDGSTIHQNPHAPAAAMTPIHEGASLSPYASPNVGASGTGLPGMRRDTRGTFPALTTSPANLPKEQVLVDFLAAELHPAPTYPITDVVWGQTERDRVYNALLAVPFQLERLVWLGVALCLNSFLSVFTLLPLRVARAAMCIISSAMRHPGRSRLRGDQLFDLLCAAMFSIVVAFLWQLKAGAIYFWVKELTQEFLKLSVLHTALELSDKICCSFGVDVLEALAASCTAFAAQPHWSSQHAINVASDAAVALALLLAHGTVLMSQALVFGVAMNSQKNTLLALLIASNFTEIKGTVLKRFDPTKLFTLASQDVVERFHLLVVLSFVLVEEAGGSGARTPSARLLSQCGYVFLAEIVIDVTKHAVLGKFNEIRPGVYREFTKDLCERISSAQSHSIHRLVGFEPFAAAALFLRVALSYLALFREGASSSSRGPSHDGAALEAVRGLMAAGTWTLIGAFVWVALTAFTAALGFAIKRGSVKYLRDYEAMRGRGRSGQIRGRSGTAFGNSPLAPVLGQPSTPFSVNIMTKKEG